MFVAPLILTLALAPADAETEAAKKREAEARVAALRAAIAQQAAAKQVVPARPIRQPAAKQPPGKGKGQPVRPGGADGDGADESVLKAAKLKTSDDDLLDFFRKRTPPAPPRDKIAGLVKKLASKDPTDADAAQGELTAIGHAAVPLLRTAMNNVDEADASARAKQCLSNIEGAGSATLVGTVTRMLAARKPAGAAEVLIAYLPYAEDQSTFEEVETALVAVAIVNGKPDGALLKALKDKEAIRRGAAATVLCQAGGPANYKHVRPLLKDPSVTVKLRASLGLVAALDAEAVPVLIGLLGELPQDQNQQAEEYLINLAGEWAVAGPKGNDRMSRHLRREVWLAWWKSTDGDKLLDEFKSRTTTDAERAKILALIDKLGDNAAEAREAATTELMGFGKKAAPLLRRVIYQGHTRIAPFATKVLDAIEKDSPNPLPGVAARLLGLRRPEGTAEALVGFAPFCESDDVLAELVEILAAVGVSGGKGADALVKGLQSDVPERRMAAVMALARGKASEDIAAMRKLLTDKDAVVRLRAAQGLVVMEDRKAVSALITLLKDLPVDMVWEAEEVLTRLAGDAAPSAAVGSDDKTRLAAVQAWAKWWEDNEKTVSLKGLDAGRRDAGVMLVIEQWSPTKGNGRVSEVDARGRVRWEISGLNWPNHAEVLKGNRVLIIEQQQRVTERDRTGKIVGLDRTYNNPFLAERLPNGDTFIACRYQMLIVDRKGEPKWTHNIVNGQQVMGARRFRDGSIAYFQYGGGYVRLDRDGKQVKTLQFGQQQTWWNYALTGVDILPGDRIVVSISNMNKVVEMTSDGKEAWSAPVTQPQFPTRLNNGNVLVAGGNNNLGTLYEIDRKGKVIRETNMSAFRMYRVMRR